MRCTTCAVLPEVSAQPRLRLCLGEDSLFDARPSKISIFNAILTRRPACDLVPPRNGPSDSPRHPRSSKCWRCRVFCHASVCRRPPATCRRPSSAFFLFSPSSPCPCPSTKCDVHLRCSSPCSCASNPPQPTNWSSSWASLRPPRLHPPRRRPQRPPQPLLSSSRNFFLRGPRPFSYSRRRLPAAPRAASPSRGRTPSACCRPGRPRPPSRSSARTAIAVPCPSSARSCRPWTCSRGTPETEPRRPWWKNPAHRMNDPSASAREPSPAANPDSATAHACCAESRCGPAPSRPRVLSGTRPGRSLRRRLPPPSWSESTPSRLPTPAPSAPPWSSSPQSASSSSRSSASKLSRCRRGKPCLRSRARSCAR
mmetsp:Transcript_1993/g.4626  ORF Transcript_1993/g.4626 Transcript_1993/m.4626 type:complete len:368 (-) Transcript_1993:1234-2337(-)